MVREQKSTWILTMWCELTVEMRWQGRSWWASSWSRTHKLQRIPAKHLHCHWISLGRREIFRNRKIGSASQSSVFVHGRLERVWPCERYIVAQAIFAISILRLAHFATLLRYAPGMRRTTPRTLIIKRRAVLDV